MHNKGIYLSWDLGKPRTLTKGCMQFKFCVRVWSLCSPICHDPIQACVWNDAGWSRVAERKVKEEEVHDVDVAVAQAVKVCLVQHSSTVVLRQFNRTFVLVSFHVGHVSHEVRERKERVDAMARSSSPCSCSALKSSSLSVEFQGDEHCETPSPCDAEKYLPYSFARWTMLVCWASVAWELALKVQWQLQKPGK